MTNLPPQCTRFGVKAIFPLLMLVVATGFMAFAAAQASASSAPIVISYEKKCDAANHCVGEAGDGGTIEMQIDPTTFRPTGDAAQLTLTEWITVGDIVFRAEMSGHLTPAGFIVLNGTVTDGSFEGAQVHQRSTFTGIDGNRTVWSGELRLVPASA